MNSLVPVAPEPDQYSSACWFQPSATPGTAHGELLHIALTALPTRGVMVTFVLAAPVAGVNCTVIVRVPEAVVPALTPSVTRFVLSQAALNHAGVWE